jgi:hypothetical protein
LEVQTSEEFHHTITQVYSDSWGNVDFDRISNDLKNKEISVTLSDFLALMCDAQDKEFARDLIEAGIYYNVMAEDWPTEELATHISNKNSGRMLSEIRRLVTP